MKSLRIAVVSDTHEYEIQIMKFLDKVQDCDYILHLGDCVKDVEIIRRHFKGKVINVRGNCDLGNVAPLLINEEIDGHRILMSHGHQFSVKSNVMSYLYKALESQAKIALFGHTHIEGIEVVEGVHLINPGSLARSKGKGNSYCIIETEKDKIDAKIMYL